MKLKGFSPAKANLFFHVLEKRPDGYHEVASLYTALSLGDVIHIESSEEDLFLSNEKTLLADGSNLVIRARDAFRKESGVNCPVSIELEKNIPIGSGLGGGSSNAATTLWMMNELFHKPLSQDQLIEIGSKIGSDVPFFFSQGAAYCTGRGEIFEHREVSGAFWIAKPVQFALSTPKVYGMCIPGEGTKNDLEPAAFRLIPELKRFKESLQGLGFSEVTMTGSGTAFICYGDIKEPKLDDTIFYPVTTIQRDQDHWYGEI